MNIPSSSDFVFELYLSSEAPCLTLMRPRPSSFIEQRWHSVPLGIVFHVCLSTTLSSPFFRKSSSGAIHLTLMKQLDVTHAIDLGITIMQLFAEPET